MYFLRFYTSQWRWCSHTPDRYLTFLPKKGKDTAVPVNTIKVYRGHGGFAPLIINLRIKWEWPASCPGHFTPGEKALSTHWTGGLVGSRAGMNVWRRETFLAPVGIRTLNSPFLSSLLLFYSPSMNKECPLYTKLHIRKCLQQLTCSVLRATRTPMVLLKKDARRGLSGLSDSRKAYNFPSNASSPARRSLMAGTSHVSSSHAILGYL